MFSARYLIIALSALMVGNTALAAQKMPPQFSFDHTPEEILQNYPLGTMNELAAFAHHGEPEHKILLPNNQKGWVYELYDSKTSAYKDLTHQNKRVREIRSQIPHRTFTLVFNSNGIVNDVLFNGQTPKFGISSLQVKRLSKPSEQMLPGYDHGIHFAPKNSNTYQE